MGRGTAAQGYEGSVDRPMLAGDQPLEPIIAHLAFLIRRLAVRVDSTHYIREIEGSARRIEDFFRARWDAPEEPTT